MLEVQRSLGRVESKVDAVLDNQVKTQVDLDALTTRTSALERFRWQIVGGGIASATIVSALWNFIAR
jgi:hypothetical protein